jgi:heme-degrading monooxygenase HmoA
MYGDNQVIARIWHGAVPLARRDEYLDQMRKVAIPDYKSISGNRGAYCLHRVEGHIAHFKMLTFWDDFDAIKRFAGEDYQVAKYYDFDRSFLIELEPYVRHYSMYDE